MILLGIDATHYINAEAIKATGYDWVGRYMLSGAYRIDKAEIDAYHSAGLSVEFFGEHQSDFMLGGAPAGTDAGKDAHNYFVELGAPSGTVCFFTCDFDAQPSQFPAIGAFLSASSIELYPYVSGIYGGISVVNAFPGYPSHQTEAWSDGQISDHANFYQRVGTTLPPISGTVPGEYDENVGINPVGLWEPLGPMPPILEGLEDMWRYMIYLVAGKNVLVDMQNEKPLKTFSDAMGPYGLTGDAARFLSAYPQSTTVDAITPDQFASAYPGYVI